MPPCSCFKPELDEPDSRDAGPGGPGFLTFFADVDCLRAYPGLRSLLHRTNMGVVGAALSAAAAAAAVPAVGSAGAGRGQPVDYTLHGGALFTAVGECRRCAWLAE